MTPTTCICYTTDPTYLFPTLLAAVQARRHSSPAKADVLIASFGSDDATQRIFREVCEREGIRFLLFDRSAIEGAQVMLARLFLDRFMPEQYRQFLYIDGDTQVNGSLDPLLDAEIPDGNFLAANDPFTFALADNDRFGRGMRHHMAAIGMSPQAADRYFNTGVLRINRTGWDDIGVAAWRQFEKRGTAFRFADQDALNLVATDCHQQMSLGWNFPIFMKRWRVERHITPRIYHFMSAPKPWNGVFPPWSADAYRPYVDIVATYPELAPYHAVMKLPRRLRYHLQQRYKRLTETLDWEFGPKWKRVLSYEQGMQPSTCPPLP